MGIAGGKAAETEQGSGHGTHMQFLLRTQDRRRTSQYSDEDTESHKIRSGMYLGIWPKLTVGQVHIELAHNLIFRLYAVHTWWKQSNFFPMYII